MQATITKTEYTGKIRQNRKENHFTSALSLLAIKEGDIIELAQARIYATAGARYACIWVHSNGTGVYTSGGGKAGGYGYHRESAALQNAINDAGITLDQDIDGCGDSAMENALHAIGSALGYEKTTIIRAHG